jgi:hypothetical protein
LATTGGYLGLIKTITSLRAGTVVEAAYSGYGTRPAIAWAAAADTTPAGGRQYSNSGLISFPANTGADEAEIAWGIYAAATGGSPLEIGFLDTIAPFVGVGFVADTIQAIAHGLSTDHRVYVAAAPGAILPAGLAEDTAYYVLAAGLTADVFKLSTTSGGTAADITTGGAAYFMPYVARTVAGGATPSVAIGAVVSQR